MNLKDNQLPYYPLKDPIEIEDYNPVWPMLAEAEINALKKILHYPFVKDIEHIGSTAIPNMKAKPIIDLYVGVEKIEDASLLINAIESLGYHHWKENPDKTRLFFVKGMPPFGSKRTHHVHVLEYNTVQWQAVILIRNHLRAHPTNAKQYEQLKLKLIEQYRFDREAYTGGKTEFIAKLLKELNFTHVNKVIMKNTLAKMYPYFTNIRQTIHANPELRYEEFDTAKLVANELTKMGLPVMTGIGGTGVVALLDSGKPGKTVALRADMDALPITENTNLNYQSKNAGKMHACGHDGHTASLLAAAYALTQLKAEFSGKIKFIFQPAEEGGAGAAAMIKDGGLTNPNVDAIFAFHNYPGFEAGTILVRHDCMLYSNTEFTLTIHGKGGHAAMPNLAIDPISVGAAIIQNTSQIIKRLSDANDPIILAITKFNSGVANNVIPDTATLVGTIRASSIDKKEHVKQQLSTMVNAIALAYGAEAVIEFNDLYPPTINTSVETELVFNTATALYGKNNVSFKPAPARASEDFSFFLQKVPGSYFLIGNGKESASCHSSHYNFNDTILPIAAEMLASIALNFLTSQ